MSGNIVKRLEWPLLREALYKCSPLIISDLSSIIVMSLLVIWKTLLYNSVNSRNHLHQQQLGVRLGVRLMGAHRYFRLRMKNLLVPGVKDPETETLRRPVMCGSATAEIRSQYK